MAHDADSPGVDSTRSDTGFDSGFGTVDTLLNVGVVGFG
jgi:hypothetical protein